ncbi:tetratricopeptide repeat protein [Xanthomarina sp. F1114]|uniref:tetratricopeptide repeat-containing sensor histidine kinase n=1 Tax=Xanthomarina sp. F1114 TaxID=2996019 RepID=UPI00225E1E47|nr:tetratricopeptide repeat-containing sensor histidine kinase [Xanthomarina sp. F1114]MCX7546971.1 tetratricopeptide repeat protein [Xanthomarina sp. F1114]
MYQKIIIILVLFFLLPLNAQNTSFNRQLDSIYFYRNLAKEAVGFDKKIEYAQYAIKLSEATHQDSTILKSKRLLATLYLRKLDVNSLFNINHENLKLATKLKDSMAIASITTVLGYYHQQKAQIDSSYYYYYTSYKVYKALNEEKREADALFNMASIQFSQRDYIGCEQSAIDAIRLFQSLPRTDENLDNLWALYNLIAIASDKLGAYDKAIEYHHKALTYSDQLSDNYLYTLYSNSNIALIYKELKDYDRALEIYHDLFKNKELLLEEPVNYALILGDYAYIKYLSKNYKTQEISQMFTEAYKISDSLQDHYSIMSVSLNASEYYNNLEKKDSALFFVNRAYTIAKETNTNDVILKSLMLKAEIEEESKAKVYLTDYVKLSDSLQNKERNIRNKFARIEFETDQIVERNKQMAKERLWLLILSIGLMFTLLLLYIIVSQRNKNKELKFNQQQQETNEEIYNLMLSQQDKIDEARVAEKKRVSQEIHDGILSRLFGIRLNLDSLNMSVQPEAIKTREKCLGDLKEIEVDLRQVSHELNTDFVSGSNYISIIRTLVETQTKAYKLKYDLINDDNIDWDEISNKTKIHYYRIIQESLQNIYKHAGASFVNISFKQKNNVICLTIADNGSGFDVNKARKGIGLKNIYTRVQEIDGKLDIQSTADSGTKISITAPNN